MKISSELRAIVARRAASRCEYCRIHEDDSIYVHEVDHVVSRQHGGETTAENLAYACMVCNRLKGTNLSSITASGDLVRLFNPRLQNWGQHFRLDGAVIRPLSPVAEVTTRLLRFNTEGRVDRRRVLQQLGNYPLD